MNEAQRERMIEIVEARESDGALIVALQARVHELERENDRLRKRVYSLDPLAEWLERENARLEGELQAAKELCFKVSVDGERRLHLARHGLDTVGGTLRKLVETR